MNSIKLNLNVRTEEKIANLDIIQTITPHQKINYFSKLKVIVDKAIDDYEGVKAYWEIETEKFFNRRRFTGNNDVSRFYKDEIEIFRITGGLAFPRKLFLSNFNGFVPKSSLIGVKSLKDNNFSDISSYEELADIYLGLKSLETKKLKFALSEKKVVMLSSAIPRNYYHWMVECLPKVLVFRELLESDPELKILIDHNLPKFVYSSLALFGITEDRLVSLNEVTIFSEIIFSSRLSFSNQTISPFVCAFYKDFVKQHCIPTAAEKAAGPRRIYISRSKAGMRRLNNEKELAQMLSSLGFETIHNEDLSILEQAQLFHGAELIVGVHGAGLTNLVFCNPQTKVIELLHDEFDQGVTSYAALAEMFSLNYLSYIGKADRCTQSARRGANFDFKVDLNALKELIGDNRANLHT